MADVKSFVVICFILADVIAKVPVADLIAKFMADVIAIMVWLMLLPLCPCGSLPEMLYVKVFWYWMYILLHIYTDIIKFSSCIFIVTWCVFTYMFMNVTVIISDILCIYYSIQTVIM